jgi:two-component system response regulator YesN
MRVDDISGRVSYFEVNAMVRLGQRHELDAFLRQFLADLDTVARSDLQTAKSRFLSLVTVMTTSVLELGAPPQTERRIADAADAASAINERSALLELAKHYVEHMNVCARPNSNRYARQVIERSKQVIAAQFSDDLTDETLANSMNLSRSHFRYLFKEITGMPFKRYLAQVRLNAARSLIEESTLSIKEISARVGYFDTSSFYRAYRAFHGVPPTAHRNASV